MTWCSGSITCVFIFVESPYNCKHFQIKNHGDFFSVLVNMTFGPLNMFILLTFNCMIQFLHDMVEDTAFYHWGHFWPCNAFPNGEVEIFCLGEYDLFDLPIMHCEVWNWQDGQKWIYAKKLELSSEYFGDIAKSCWISFCFISSKIFNCKLQFLHDMVEDTAFYHCIHFCTLQCISKWEIEFFCFGEYDLFDLLNMCCKVWKWHERKKWMCATVLWRNWSLAVNILEDIAKSCWISFSLIVSKTFNCKLQFLHDMVEDTAFYHCGHFLTLQCISK